MQERGIRSAFARSLRAKRIVLPEQLDQDTMP
jgi:hypothetical protein